MWGSGTTQGRGPRYTADALQDGRLVGTLVEVSHLIGEGNLAGAHRRFRISGAGSAFYMKFFWGFSLAMTDAPALILDRRVRETLARLTGERWALPGATQLTTMWIMSNGQHDGPRTLLPSLYFGA